MSEENILHSSVKVRDLITAFENKKSTTPDYPRPRARSLGDVLSKNVVVRQNQYSNTFEDIEEALKQFDKKLSQYGTYKKEQHVTLQNEVFNILSSIVSVKSDEEKKRYLITNTQRFVALLNRKLPSNNLTSSSSDQHKYITYDRYVGKTREDDNNASGKPRTSVNNGEEVIPIAKLRQHFEPRVTDDAKNKQITITNEDDKAEAQEEVVSIPKLREHFEPRSKDATKGVIVEQRTFRSNLSLSLQKPDVVDSPISKESRVTTIRSPLRESQNEPVSVSKLRNLFDKERQSEGLGEILRNEHTKFKFRVMIPYNARRQPVRTPQNSRGVRIIRTAPEEEPADSESSSISDSDLDDEDSTTFVSSIRIDEIQLGNSTGIIKGPLNDDSEEVRYEEPTVVSVGAFGYVEGHQENRTETSAEFIKIPSNDDSDEVEYEEPIVLSSVGGFGYAERHQQGESSTELISTKIIGSIRVGEISTKTDELKIEEISMENSTETDSGITESTLNDKSDEVEYEEPIVVSVGAHEENIKWESPGELTSTKIVGSLKIEEISLENSSKSSSAITRDSLNDDSGSEYGSGESNSECSNDSIESVKNIKTI